MNWDEPFIICENFSLRPFKYNDAESLARHANDPKVARFLRSTFPHPYLIYDAQKFICGLHKQKDQFVLAIEITGEAAGAIGIYRTYYLRKPIWEVGYWIGRKHWNKNITTEALAQIIAYYAPRLKMDEVYAKIYEPNVASAKVLQKCGFTLLSCVKGVMLRNEAQVNEQVWIKKL